jgi:hypothetical protein
MIDQNPFFQSKHGFVRWEPELRAVYSVVDGPLEDAEYQGLMQMVLELAALKGSKLWLANHLKSRPAKAAMLEWTTELWVPMADQIGFTRIAALTPERAATRMSLERLLGKRLELRFFLDHQEARNWLLETP